MRREAETESGRQRETDGDETEVDGRLKKKYIIIHPHQEMIIFIL